MQTNIINVKKLIVTLYMIIPSLFYLFFYFLSLKYGELPVYFFGKMILTPNDLFNFFVIHFFIGIMVFILLRKTKYEILYKSCKNIYYNLAIAFIYIFVTYIQIPYFNDILYIIFIILLASYRPEKLGFFILFFVAILQIVIFKDRFPIVLISMLYFLPIISKQNYRTLILLVISSIFSMIFILQPLKGGNIPFTNDYFNLAYSIKHMYPILIGAATSANANVDGLQIFSESIPLLKGILHYPSIVDVVAYNTLSEDAIENGTRLGSNTTLFLNPNGFYVLSILLLIIFLLMNIFKSKLLYNSTLLFFIIYGPYFIRRFFGSYVLDFILMSFIIFFIYIAIFIFRKLKIIKKRKKYV